MLERPAVESATAMAITRSDSTTAAAAECSRVVTRVAGNGNRGQGQGVHQDGCSFNFRGQSGINGAAGVRCDVQTGECTKGSASRHEHGGY